MDLETKRAVTTEHMSEEGSPSSAGAGAGGALLHTHRFCSQASNFICDRWGEKLQNENTQSLVHKTGKTALNGVKKFFHFPLFPLIIYHGYLLLKVILNKENFNFYF